MGTFIRIQEAAGHRHPIRNRLLRHNILLRPPLLKARAADLFLSLGEPLPAKCQVPLPIASEAMPAQVDGEVVVDLEEVAAVVAGGVVVADGAAEAEVLVGEEDNLLKPT